jgi:DNA-binding NarL/FixJ family response regulator
MPIEAATSRLELATSLGSAAPEVAIAEARTALDTFRRADASRLEREAVAVLRTLGVREAEVTRTGGELTKREAEVLTLIGEGLSNPEIGARLYVSRKTVEYHVSNVLAKLGLRSRAEAAAYAIRAQGETRVPS